MSKGRKTTALSFRVPDDLLVCIDEVAKRLSKSRTEVLLPIIARTAHYFEKVLVASQVIPHERIQIVVEKWVDKEKGWEPHQKQSVFVRYEKDGAILREQIDLGRIELVLPDGVDEARFMFVDEANRKVVLRGFKLGDEHLVLDEGVEINVPGVEDPFGEEMSSVKYVQEGTQLVEYKRRKSARPTDEPEVSEEEMDERQRKENEAMGL
ncbi:hypothetical protein ES703_93069 [subsurface metagenome]